MKLVRAGEGTEFPVRVQPRASRSEVVGVRGERLRVRVAAPPVDGAANDELRRLLASRLGLPPSAVTVVRGAASRDKRVRVEGLSPRAVQQRMGL